VTSKDFFHSNRNVESRYEGEFENGQFHGKGTLYFKEGKFEGTWKHGKVS